MKAFGCWTPSLDQMDQRSKAHKMFIIPQINQFSTFPLQKWNKSLKSALLCPPRFPMFWNRFVLAGSGHRIWHSSWSQVPHSTKDTQVDNPSLFTVQGKVDNPLLFTVQGKVDNPSQFTVQGKVDNPSLFTLKGKVDSPSPFMVKWTILHYLPVKVKLTIFLVHRPR